MLDTEQIVDDLKTLAPGRVVCSGDIHDRLVLAIRVIPQESEDGNNTLRRDVDAQFVLVYGVLLDELGKSRE